MNLAGRERHRRKADAPEKKKLAVGGGGGGKEPPRGSGRKEGNMGKKNSRWLAQLPASGDCWPMGKRLQAFGIRGVTSGRRVLRGVNVKKLKGIEPKGRGTKHELAEQGPATSQASTDREPKNQGQWRGFRKDVPIEETGRHKRWFTMQSRETGEGKRIGDLQRLPVLSGSRSGTQ